MNKIVLLVLTAALLVGSFLTFRDVTYMTENGEVLRRISAAKELKSAKNEWKGEVTEDVLRRVIEENQKILAETSDLDEASVKQQGLRDIHEMLNNGFAGFDEWDYYRADSLSPEEAAGIYQIRVDSLKEYLSKEEVKDTFFYEYAEGWKALLDSQYLPTLMTLLVVIPFALSCAPMFLGRITILTRLVSFFPDMLLRICTYHDEFLLCEIGGKVMGVFTFLIPYM